MSVTLGSRLVGFILSYFVSNVAKINYFFKRLCNGNDWKSYRKTHQACSFFWFSNSNQGCSRAGGNLDINIISGVAGSVIKNHHFVLACSTHKI